MPIATRVAAAAIPAAALALYWGALNHPLVFDDAQLAREVLASRPGIDRRALSNLSFQWVHALLGADPVWQRLANVLLHGATGAALFGFLSRLFQVVIGDERARWTAFFGALAFVLHPVAVYGVAYLIQRSIIMATLFSVLSLWCVLEGIVRRSAAWQVAAGAVFVLAVFSKEHAVMLPAVAVALLVLVRGYSHHTRRHLGLAFALLGIAAAVIAYQLRWLIGVAYEPLIEDIGVPAELALPLSMVNQAWLYFRYLLTWIVPCPCWMSVDLRVAFPAQLFAWPQVAGAIAYLMYPLAAGALIARRGMLGLLGFGLLYPWLLALTELATVRVQEPYALYRSYLWMSGLPAALPALLSHFAPRLRHAALVAICIALVPLAWNRLATFSHPLRLWDDAVRKNTNPGAHYRERAYLNRGEFLREAGRTQEALADFDLAISLNPRLAEGYVRRATLHLEAGRMQDALSDLDRAIALDARNAPAHARRCMAALALRRPDAETVADCERAIALDASDAESWLSAGIAQHALGRMDAAAASYRRALELAPADASAHYNYGRLLLQQNRRDEAARRHFIMACKGGVAPACATLREVYGTRKP